MANLDNNSANIPQKEHVTAAKARAGADQVSLPKIFKDDNVRGYEKLFRKEVEALNIRKQNTEKPMPTYVNRVKELKRLQSNPIDTQVLRDPVVNRITVFRKLQKPNRPMSRDYSFPFYKQMHTQRNREDVISNSPPLRIGREITAILDYTDFNHYNVDNFRLPPIDHVPKKLSTSHNVFLTNNLIPHSNKTWPFVYSPNTNASSHPFCMFDTAIVTPRLHLVKNVKLQLKADKAVIHTSAKRKDKDFCKPRWTAILDAPHPTMDLFGSALDLPELRRTSQSDAPSPTPDDNEFKVKFARGGGFISRIPVNKKERDEEEA